MAEKNEVEIGTNCAECKKALMKQKRYYRNNAYFCNLNCYKKKISKEKAALAEASAEAAAE